MKTLTLKLFAGACALLLAACGADQHDTSAPSAQAPSTRLLADTQTGPLTPQHYHDALQRAYVAYFGRPADPGGLEFYANHYFNFGASTEVRTNLERYATNAGLRELIDSFGTSAESKALYPGEDNVQFVTAIYRNMLGRDPDAGGLAFWSGHLNSGALSRGQAALYILISTQGDDQPLIDAKIATATRFTQALNTNERRAAYDGQAANEVVRAMLSKVTMETTPQAATAMVEETISQLVAVRASQMGKQAVQIVQSRCVACHSAQPSNPGFPSAPRGIRYDTEAQIRADAQRINTVVQSGYMPWGNATGMTSAERAQLASWIAAGTP